MRLRCSHSLDSFRLDVDLLFTKPWTVIFGSSGSGKSTLLRILAGLLQPRDASLALGEEELAHLPPHRRGIALVSQQPALFPHMTVRQNVIYGCRGHNCFADSDNTLEQYRLSHVADAKPGNISGGERQRTAIARAVQSYPRVLLLDEVFTGLQASLRTEITGRLKAEQATQSHYRGLRIVSVTHDVTEALRADEVIQIDEGRVVAQGTPSFVLAPESAALRRQLGELFQQ
jgi:molybdate transport system ATP-binding protein